METMLLTFLYVLVLYGSSSRIILLLVGPFVNVDGFFPTTTTTTTTTTRTKTRTTGTIRKFSQIPSFRNSQSQRHDRVDRTLNENDDTTSKVPKQRDLYRYLPPGPIHHVAIKTRNITTAIQFYSLLGFEPTVQFRAGPARAAWLEQKTPCNNPSSMSPADASVSARLELIEIPSFMLNEQDGQTIRAIDLMKRQELLGYNHIALDVTESVDLLDSTNTTSLSEWIQQLNQRSVEMFGKTLRIALKPQQQIIGNSVYELAFIYDADGALLELIRKQTDLPQNVDSGWEPWDGQGFRNAQPPPNY